LMASIVEGTDLMVQVVDLNFNWLAINHAAAQEYSRLFKVPLPRAGDNMLEPIIHLPEQHAAVKAVWARALGGEEFITTAEFGETPPERKYYEMRFRSLRDQSGQLIGAYQFVLDVTERVREQGRLAQVEATLLQMQKMDAVGQLTGGIAHDFNNLLQGISGSLELIKRKPDDATRVLRWAESGLRAAERGAKLTGQLLAFSRVQKLELRPLLVTQVVASMRGLLERTLGPTIRIRYQLEVDALPVLGDEVQLEMAILNLAINARDAMPQGGDLLIAVRYRTVVDDPELGDGVFLELSVADSGHGMTPEVLARAFDPFFTTKGVGRGTGLGLSQVYGTVRQAGGAVRIESTPERGTMVRLLLRPTDAPVTQQVRPPERPVVKGSAATVLVVDDDPDVRMFLTETLEQLGYTSLAVEDGRAGLRALEKMSPDAIILDYAMPGMSGAEVAHEMRQRSPDLPIIFASGFADTAAIEAAAGERAPVLRKPFRVEDLHRALVEAIARRGPRGQSRRN
jgi:signal transduction histidine kinase/CheY-like chemotaxis protein